MSRIGMIVFSYYPSDPRVNREAEALSNTGFDVDVICLKGENESEKEEINGVHAVRCNLKRSRKSKMSYLFEYGIFGLYAFYMISIRAIFRKYTAIHVHNMPDFLVFCAAVPKLFGCKVILDLHDPTPEVFITKYSIPERSLVIRLLVFIEKVSIGFSDFVITPNEAFKNLFIERGCPSNKIAIVMNSPVEDIFNKNGHVENAHTQPTSAYTVMYHGTIVERHGLDDALKAIKTVSKTIPDIRFLVCGDGDEFVCTFKAMIKELNLDNIVTYLGRLSYREIAERIAEIDLGLIPNKMSVFTNINFPTRIFEYIAMDKVCIVPRTKGILDYFTDDDIFFFHPGDVRQLAERISFVLRNKESAQNVLKRGKNIYLKHRWSIEKKKLTNLYSTIHQRTHCQ